MRKIDVRPGFILFLGLLWFFAPAGVFTPFLLAAALHELGHLAAIWALGGQVRGIRLGFGDAQIRMQPMDYRRERLCALAGPGINLLCGLLREQAPVFAALSLLLGLFNLLPIAPLDGGKILINTLLLHLEQGRAEKLAQVGSVLCASALVLFGIFAAIYWQAGFWPLAAALAVLLRLVQAGKSSCFSGDYGIE